MSTQTKVALIGFAGLVIAALITVLVPLLQRPVEGRIVLEPIWLAHGDQQVFDNGYAKVQIRKIEGKRYRFTAQAYLFGGDGDIVVPDEELAKGSDWVFKIENREYALTVNDIRPGSSDFEAAEIVIYATK